MPYVILVLVLVLIVYLATKNLSQKPDKSTLVGLYLAAAVVLFVFATLMMLAGRLFFAIPAFILGFGAVGKFLQEKRLFLWRSGAFADKDHSHRREITADLSEAYKILGVNERATREDVRTAFKMRLADLEADPERNADRISELKAAKEKILGPS